MATTRGQGSGTLAFHKSCMQRSHILQHSGRQQPAAVVLRKDILLELLLNAHG
jgi:hypothetical protein